MEQGKSPLSKRFSVPTRELIERARELRRNATEAERLLWQHLRRLQLHGYRFRRQHPLGEYILDFFCFEKALAIELDGNEHLQQVEYDSERTKWLESQGIQVLRFQNAQVLQEIEAVKQAILEALR